MQADQDKRKAPPPENAVGGARLSDAGNGPQIITPA
jgi:hypothetical protein